jgi:trehalose 6-phosphate phosphatase
MTAVRAQSAPPPPDSVGDWALFLDIDGTLLDIAATPEAVHVPPGLDRVLTRLSERLTGALALVSGRSVRVIDQIFAPLKFPAAGQHGAELRLNPGSNVANLGSETSLDWLRAELPALRALSEGLIIEDKGQSIAVHYRAAPACAADVERILTRRVRDHADGFQLLAGKMLLEIKPKAISKASAIAEFMEHMPFAGRVPVFAGDDTTDVDGFAGALALGGHAIQVGPRPAPPGAFFLPSPAALREWLTALVREPAR